MNINSESVISLQHYSIIGTIKAYAIDSNENSVSVRFTKEFSANSFQLGDPVVFGFMAGEEIVVNGGIISQLDIHEKNMLINTDKGLDGKNDNRLYDRHPVSLYADIKTSANQKKLFATISDLSYYGMQIHMKEEVAIGEEIGLDVFLDRTIMAQRGTVVRRTDGLNHIKYGLRLIHNDFVSYNYIKLYIKSLQEKHISLLNRNYIGSVKQGSFRDVDLFTSLSR